MLCVILCFSKYACVIPLKDKKGITVTSTFQRILDTSTRKWIKILVDKGSEIYNRTKKSWLQSLYITS